MIATEILPDCTAPVCPPPQQPTPPPIVNLFGETGSVPTTVFFTADPSERLYAIWGVVAVTSPGTSGGVVVSISFSNGMNAAGAALLNSPIIGLTTIGEQGFLLGPFHSAAAQPISYSTTASGQAGSPVYSLRLRVQCLG